MMELSDPIANLISAFSRLPGIGERTATRLAFHVMNQPQELAETIASALIAIKREVKMCRVCHDLTEQEICRVCSSERRDQTQVCVVQSPTDLRAIERTGDYTGTYHVLHGLISPIDGVGPEDIKIGSLIRRLGESSVGEVILATPPSVDGEATAIYLTRLVKPLGITVSRIASGVPIGGDLEYVDRVTLARAISQRLIMP